MNGIAIIEKINPKNNESNNKLIVGNKYILQIHI